MTRSTKHFWWVWIGIEIVFVSLLFIALPAKASPIWECKSEGGWSQSPIGDFTEIPKTDDTDTNILEFQAPNKMRVEAFRYLEKKRMLHDDDYRDIKSLQNRMGKTQQAIKEWEANKAQEQLRSDESLIEENARLMDEIHWLKTELSGLSQTLKWSQRAKR